MAALFQKSYEELKEAFVRARFAEQNIFGRPDIEEWLTQQRQAEKPEQTAWPKFLSSLSHAGNDPWHLMYNYATTLGVLNRDFGSIGQENENGPVLDLLLDGLYWGEQVGIYVKPDRNRPPNPALFVIHETAGDGIKMKRILSTKPGPGVHAALDVIYAEWGRQRPKRYQARAFLCDMLEEQIKTERTKARTDFDEAVAVSADGTKILKVNWVAVADTSLPLKRATIFPGSAFRDRKILRAASTTQLNSIWHPWVPGPNPRPNTADDIVHDLSTVSYTYKSSTERPWWSPQTWGHLCPWLNEHRTTLITPPDLCPSPLPEGGVNVRV